MKMDENIKAFLDGEISLQELCEAIDKDIYDFAEVYPSVNVACKKQKSDYVLTATVEERIELDGEEPVFPDQFKNWLVEKKGWKREDVEKLDPRTYDGEEFNEFINQEGVGEDVLYPLSSAIIGAHVDMWREAGFEGGTTHGPIPDHVHTEFEKKVKIPIKEVEKQAGKSIEDFIVWLIDKIGFP